jgi:anti-sigma B factor antagonist
MIILGGGIDVDANERLRKIFNDSVNSGIRFLVVNCADVSTVDSAGLQTLLQAATRTRGSGGNMFLVKVPPAVTKILDLTGSGTKFEILPDEAAAFKAAGL